MAKDRQLSHLENDRNLEKWKDTLLDTAVICPNGFKALPAEAAEWVKRFPHVFRYRPGDESYVNLLHYENRHAPKEVKK